MKKIYLKARAKVNLTLNVLNKREDGYHNLRSIFQKINFYDEMWLEKLDNNNFILESNINNVEIKDNIIYKCFHKMQKEILNLGGVKVTLKKNIPMQAGLAGGSTDCASFILGMNRLYNLNLSEEEIKEIGESLGADVVPCLYNRAVKGEGIGNIITQINTNFKYYLVIVKSDVSCNTKEMFEILDKNTITSIDNTEKIIYALENNNINEIAKNLTNDFETITKRDMELVKAKELILKNGALNSMLSGSGSCVFGIFENKDKAKKAYDNLKKIYKTYICTSYNSRKSSFDK